MLVWYVIQSTLDFFSSSAKQTKIPSVARGTVRKCNESSVPKKVRSPVRRATVSWATCAYADARPSL